MLHPRAFVTLMAFVVLSVSTGCPPPPFSTTGEPVTASIGPEGGSFTLSSTTLEATLEVPEGALADEIELSMVELASFALLPLDDVRGVVLAPAGLTFLTPAELRLDGGARRFSLADDAAYLAPDDAADTTRVEALPLFVGDGVARVQIPHFSAAAVGTGVAGAVAGARAKVAAAIQTAAASGQTPADADLIALLEEFFDDVVRPALTAAQADFAKLADARAAFSGWDVLAQELGSASSGIVPGTAALRTEGRDGLATALKNEIGRINDRVRASGDYRDVAPLIDLADIAEDMGFDDAEGLDRESVVAMSAVQLVVTTAIDDDNVLTGTASVVIAGAPSQPASLVASLVVSGGAPETADLGLGPDGAFTQQLSFELDVLTMTATVNASLTDLPGLGSGSASSTAALGERVTVSVAGPGAQPANSTTARPGETVTVELVVARGSVGFNNSREGESC